MWRRDLARSIAAAGMLAASGTMAAAVNEQQGGWTTYRNARHGFMIAYPAGVFENDAARETEDGRMVVSRDGQAKLLVGAFANESALSMADYRQQLLTDNYSGATLDYAPVKDRWFVLSGVRDGVMFYERVTFTCGGRLINSWAMLYPATERRRFDRVVEAVARSYAPGAGRDGKCE